MPSSKGNNLPSETVPQPTTSFQDKISTELGRLCSKGSILKSIYYANIAFVLFSVIFNRPAITIFVVIAHLSMAALDRLVHISIQPDTIDDDTSVHMEEQTLSEQMAINHRYLKISSERIEKLLKLIEQLLGVLKEQEEEISTLKADYIPTGWQRCELDTLENEELPEVLTKLFKLDGTPDIYYLKREAGSKA